MSEVILPSVLAAAAREIGGAPEQTQFLSTRESLRTVRLSRDGASCVAKYLPDEAKTRRQDLSCPFLFANECANYVFLEQTAFSARPKLLARGPNFVVLDDLGRSDWDRPDDEACFFAVNEVFTSMHAATLGRESEWRRSVEAEPELNPDEDPRQEEPFRLARFARDHLLTMAEAMEISQVAEPRDHFDRHLNRVRKPDHRLHAFVHWDLCSPRQLIANRDGVMKLLDFEHGRFSMSLVDPMLLVVGKLEFFPYDDEQRIRSPRFPLRHLEIYRQLLGDKTGVAVPDSIWTEAMASTLVFMQLRCLGQLLQPTIVQTLRPSLPWHLKRFFGEQAPILESLSETRPLAEVFRQLESRMFVGLPE